MKTPTGNYLDYNRNLDYVRKPVTPVKKPPARTASVDTFLNALAKQESGGSYTAKSHYTDSKGNHAFGKYQILGTNIGPWTKQYLGKAMTVQQFLNDPKAQDTLMQKRASDLFGKYGNWEDVAAVHFSGRPLQGNMSADKSGTTVPQYVQNILKFMGIGTASADTLPSGGGKTLQELQAMGAKPAGQSAPMTPKTGGKTLQELQAMGAKPAGIQMPSAPDTSNTALGNSLADRVTNAASYLFPGGPAIGKPILGALESGVESITRVGATAAAGLTTAIGDVVPALKPAATAATTQMEQNPTFARPYTNVPDYLSGLLDTASWTVGGEEVKPLEAAVPGAKAAVKSGVESAKTLLTGGMGIKNALTFASLQGGSTAAKAIGQGKDQGTAIQEGLIGAGGSLTALGTMGILGWGIGHGADAFSKTAASQYAGKFLGDTITAIKGAITPSLQENTAAKLVNGVKSAAKSFAETMKTIVSAWSGKAGGMFKGLPEPKKSATEMIGGIYDNLKPTRSAIGAGFKEVFDTGPSLTAGDEGATAIIKSFEDAQKRAGALSPEEIAMHIAQYGAAPASLAPSLDRYLSRFEQSVIAPLKSGGDVPMQVLDDVIHFMAPTGVPAEKAIATGVQADLYKAFENKMKQSDPQLLEKWLIVKDQFQALTTRWDGKFKDIIESIPRDAHFMEGLARSFIEGDHVQNPGDSEFLNQIFGPKGMAMLQDGITKELFKDAGRAYNVAVRTGTPKTVVDAGQAAAKVFDDFIAKAEKGNSDTTQFFDPRLLEFMQHARDGVSGDMWSAARNAEGIGFLDKGVTDKVEQLWKNLQGGSKAYETALKTPSKLAEKISTFSPEELTSIKSLTEGKVVGQNEAGQDITAWDVLTGNVIKNLLQEASNAFSGASTADVTQKFLSGIGELGGANKDDVARILFGDKPELMKGFNDMFASMKYINSIEGKDKAAIQAVAHGMAGMFFAVIHHPMFAAGEARASFKALSKMSASDMEKQFVSELQKSGRIKIRPLLSAIKSILQGYPLQQVLGRVAPQSVESSQQAPPPDQPSQTTQ